MAREKCPYLKNRCSSERPNCESNNSDNVVTGQARVGQKRLYELAASATEGIRLKITAENQEYQPGRSVTHGYFGYAITANSPEDFHKYWENYRKIEAQAKAAIYTP